MSKRIISLFLLALAPFLFCAGCNNEEEQPQFKMKAKILAVNSHIEVEILKDEYNSGLLWVNYSKETKIVNSAGKSITLEDLKEGDEIEIVYSGQVMMSYPGQIYAQRITLL